MKAYSVYFLRQTRIQRVERIVARDDDHALRIARTFPDTGAKEVWDKGRPLGSPMLAPA